MRNSKLTLGIVKTCRTTLAYNNLFIFGFLFIPIFKSEYEGSFELIE